MYKNKNNRPVSQNSADVCTVLVTCCRIVLGRSGEQLSLLYVLYKIGRIPPRDDNEVSMCVTRQCTVVL